MNREPIILLKTIERKEVSEKRENDNQLIERTETIEIVTTIREKVERIERTEKITQKRPVDT